MKTIECHCGNTLFFDSVECIRCQSAVGLCEGCLRLVPYGDGICCHCDVRFTACRNRNVVCNVWTSESGQPEPLCRYCNLTKIIPDLNLGSNLERWQALENAKRRVLVGAQQFGFPADQDTFAGPFPLTFEFKSDGENHPVTTGHADGCITINLRETNPVEREKSRQRFDEPHRTLVGHFRHELGHYYWDLLVRSGPCDRFRELFGDERQPTYADCQSTYYEHGPPSDWPARFISAYASMHPWEDFAETFATLLDMGAIVGTVSHFGLLAVGENPTSNFDDLLQIYRKAGVFANELNRDMGLVDLVPEVVNETVASKLRFVFDLKLSV